MQRNQGWQEEGDKAAKRQIRNILLVMGSAIAFGLLTLFLFVASGRENNRYSLQEVLLSPEVIPQLAYRELGQGPPFVFDQVEFKYFHPQRQQWVTVEVSEELYRRFYERIREDVSLRELDKETTALFEAKHPARLTLWVKSSNGKSTERQVFQEIGFAEKGDLYRVELHGLPMGQWIYFKHPQIAKEAFDLFVPGT